MGCHVGIKTAGVVSTTIVGGNEVTYIDNGVVPAVVVEVVTVEINNGVVVKVDDVIVVVAVI